MLGWVSWIFWHASYTAFKALLYVVFVALDWPQRDPE